MLPLDLPARALEKIQQGKPVTRGTLQAKWKLVSLNACRDLGRSQDSLDQHERLEARHLVCADVVLPGGPLSDKVHTGDILLKLEEEPVTSLLQVEIYMDDHVHEAVTINHILGQPGRICSRVHDRGLGTRSPPPTFSSGTGPYFRIWPCRWSSTTSCSRGGLITCVNALPSFTEKTLLDFIEDIPITDTG